MQLTGDSRIVYRPSSGSDQVWASNSSGVVAPEAVGDTDVELLPTQIEASLPAVPEELITNSHAAVAAASSVNGVHQEGLQDADNPIKGCGDPLDAGMELNIAHLSLDDTGGVDDGLLSSPGSDILPLQQASVTESFEQAYAEKIPSLDDDSSSLREDMDPQILDQLEQMSIASSQPSGFHARGMIDAFGQDHGHRDSILGASNEEGSKNSETVADVVHELKETSSSGENFLKCMQCAYPATALITGIHMVSCARRHFSWGGGHQSCG